LNKKDHKGCESPDPDSDPYSHSLTPEEKYSRMNEEYQRVMQQNSLRVSYFYFYLFQLSLPVGESVKDLPSVKGRQLSITQMICKSCSFLKLEVKSVDRWYTLYMLP